METAKPLSGTHLHLYFTLSQRALSGRLAEAYLALLPPGMGTAIRGYRRWQDRQATLFGRLLLLRALRSAFPGRGMEKFRSLAVTDRGKPFIPGGPAFSISHSGEMVVLAVAGQGAVGIDIEQIRPIPLEGFSRYLPEVKDLPDRGAAVSEPFFALWTQKEAVLKGAGEGLLAPLGAITLGEGTARFNGATWFINQLPIGRGYCCHVATERPPTRLAFEQVNLLDGAFGPAAESP